MSDIRNLASDMAQVMARWEIMIENNVLSENYNFILDEIYENVTKYLKPMEFYHLIKSHKNKIIGGYKNV